MKAHNRWIMLALVASFAAGATATDVYVVGQKSKKFTVDELSIKVGDSVEFLNEDPFHHNVFSLSDTATFDLGSYDQGQSKSVVFDSPGEVEVECAIHPRMRMLIKVEG